MAVAVIAVITTALYLRTDDLATAIGEQRTLTLEDGTRVYLNTDTRIAQHYDKQNRHVELERGEALFEVAKRPDWPFVVTAGDKQVRALGTAFIVRRDEQNLAITLVEGKVAVSPVNLALRSAVPPSPVPGERLTDRRRDPSIEQTTGRGRATPLHGVERKGSAKREGEALLGPEGEVLLYPGERLTFGSTQPPQLDRPSLDRITAWQRGQVALDNTPLADAVAEMNRYSNVRLVIEDPRVAAIPVSGIFRAGDSEYFAQAVAKTYQLSVVDRRNEILLTGQ